MTAANDSATYPFGGWEAAALREHGAAQPPSPPASYVVDGYRARALEFRRERDEARAELDALLGDLRRVLRMTPEQGRAEVVRVVEAIAGLARVEGGRR
jgi:hypothetical protein